MKTKYTIYIFLLFVFLMPLAAELANSAMTGITTTGLVGEFVSGFDASGDVLGGVEEVLDNFLPENVLQKVFEFNDKLRAAWRLGAQYLMLAMMILYVRFAVPAIIK